MTGHELHKILSEMNWTELNKQICNYDTDCILAEITKNRGDDMIALFFESEE